jgi:pilus assembly protein CpaC
MNFRRFLILLSFLLAGANSALAGVPTTVLLNKSVLLNLKHPARYVTVANKEIVEIPDPLRRNQLLLNGRKIGTTNLLVWEEGVERPTFFDVAVVGDQETIETAIRERAPKDAIAARYVNDTLELSGTVANDLTRKKVEEIAAAYVPKGKVLNHITVENAQQVLLEVKVAQVDKTSLRNLGISAVVKGNDAEAFTNLVGAPSKNSTSSAGRNGANVGSGLSGISGIAQTLGSFDSLESFTAGVSYFPAGIGAVLQALSTKGLAKILAEPNLLVKSGEEGNFLAGSRIPYSVLVSTGGATTTSIVFETVGVKLKFKPEVLESGNIKLKIDPAEVSSIAGTLAVNGYPIIDTRDVRTSVELKDGESLVLAGLLQEEQIKTMSKIPILGDIPVLGALFRATHNELRDKELVFFITPKLIRAIPPGMKPVLPTDVSTEEEEKELTWMPTGE